MLVFSRLRKATNVAWAAVFGLQAGFRSKPVMFMDIGGRGGLAPQWHYLYRAGLISPIFIEPEPKAASEIKARYASSLVMQEGIWSREEDKTLYITSQPGASSMFMPSGDPKLPESIKGMLKIEKEIKVHVVTAETALNRLDVVPEILKIDIQGGEVEALKGFGDLLHSIPCVELEVTFMRCYKEQPLFCEVYDYMTSVGFGLFDLKVFGVYGTRNAVQANAFFCREVVASPRHKAVENSFPFGQWLFLLAVNSGNIANSFPQQG